MLALPSARHGSRHSDHCEDRKPEALDCIEQLVAASDGAMVARGDLGVEAAAEQVPIAQKRIIRICNEASKPVITATQMLDSMIRNPAPPVRKPPM